MSPGIFVTILMSMGAGLLMGLVVALNIKVKHKVPVYQVNTEQQMDDRSWKLIGSVRVDGPRTTTMIDKRYVITVIDSQEKDGE